MKILFCGLHYDYGDPRRGFSYEYHNFLDTLKKMDGGRHEVLFVPTDEGLLPQRKNALQENVLGAAQRFRPDVAVFVLFEYELAPDTLQAVTRKLNGRTINLFTNDQFLFDEYSRHVAPYFGWVATFDRNAVAKYKKIGIANAVKTEWGCNHFIYSPQETPFVYDVSFVGQSYGARKKNVEKIRASGVAMECFGYGWPNKRISQDEMIRVFSGSKINLNFTKPGRMFSVKNIGGILLAKKGGSLALRSPGDWWVRAKTLLQKPVTQIKGRNFEIPGCGGFLLTEQAKGLSEYFADGKEIVTFSDIEDLIEKIRYWLAHDEERKAIARAGYERTLRDHTYERRFHGMFRAMGLPE